MRHLRLHLLLGYGMAGSIGPFFPEFLRSGRGFDAVEIGNILAASQVLIMASPVVLTYFADRNASPRLLAAAIFGLSIITLAGVWVTDGFWTTLLLYSGFGFAFAAMFPSMDGLFFAVQRKRALDGLETPPYHRIRVLGTIGFIVPSLLLLAFIPVGGNLVVILPTGIAFAAAALANSSRLPDPRPRAIATEAPARMPTIEAMRTLFSGRTLAFCCAMALLQIAHMGYYGFYPVHLVQALEIDARWLGTISNIGVATEAVLLLGYGWLSERIGPRGLLIAGTAATALRLAVIALAPSAGLAIAINALHGPIVLGTLVAPVIFINRLAGDSFRNSMQGVYVVVVLGPAKIASNLLCGWLAGMDTRLAFAVGAASAAISAVILWIAVSPDSEKPAAG